MKRVFIILVSILMGTLVEAQVIATANTAVKKEGEVVSSAILARAMVEQFNAAQMSYAAAATKEYHEITVELEKYSHAFDVIDLLYSTLHTASTAYTTYQSITGNLAAYSKLLDDYKDKVKKTGGMLPADVRILAIAADAIAGIRDDCEAVFDSYKSFAVLYASGLCRCTSGDLMALLEETDSCLKSLDERVYAAYQQTWRYIQIRFGYSNKRIHQIRSTSEIAHAALGRWMDAAVISIKNQSE